VKPDLIHSHFVGTTLVMRVALGRHHWTPRVFQVPGPLHLEGGPYGPVETALAGRRDHWIASCEWTRTKYLSVGILQERVHLSFYGTDVPRFEALPKGRLRKELAVGEEVPLVGMVAFMYPPKRYLGHSRGLKGHEDLIDAMALVRKSFPKARAVLVGSQWGGGSGYEERLRQQAMSLLGDAAVFLGHREDVPAIYADLDVAVHPSLSENLGGAVESSLAGVPTVATDVGGLPDIVRDGDTGWLVPPRCPQRLADAVIHALSDPAEARRRAANGRSLAMKALDVHRTAREVMAIYEKVLGGRCRRR
jgi:glycosyltransferase involved in cell wall biosynthesis